jgi:uncharacterized protein YpmB
MKQIILSILMVIITSLSFGQSKSITPNVSLFYGTQNTFGVDFITRKNDIVYGGGVSFYGGKGGFGTEYTGIFGPNTYSNEIYDITIKKDMSENLHSRHPLTLIDACKFFGVSKML